jgi:hypothetical protein
MSDSPLDVIEAAVADLMEAFDVSEPPVPVEIMLQRPKAGMWKEVNLSELSTAFISVKQRYSPRMSVGRLLARNVCRSEWGIARNLETLGSDEDTVRVFARAILMPRAMLEALPHANRMPVTIGARFEVPEDDVTQRLQDLGFPVK